MAKKKSTDDDDPEIAPQKRGLSMPAEGAELFAEGQPKNSAHSMPAESASFSVKPYVVLARKYRPATFDDLIGQDAMVTTLRNAFASGRIAQGYMLTGVRGVGKTTTARILAHRNGLIEN